MATATKKLEIVEYTPEELQSKINVLLSKISSNTATAEEMQQLSVLLNNKAEQQKQEEKAVSKIIEDIKSANIDPQVLTNLLASENLIILPEPEPEPVTLFNVPYSDKNGNTKYYKWHTGKKAVGLTAKYYTKLKEATLDEKKSWATEEGKKWLETEEGKNWLNSDK